jgi:hypothetical protein
MGAVPTKRAGEINLLRLRYGLSLTSGGSAHSGTAGR